MRSCRFKLLFRSALHEMHVAHVHVGAMVSVETILPVLYSLYFEEHLISGFAETPHHALCSGLYLSSYIVYKSCGPYLPYVGYITPPC